MSNSESSINWKKSACILCSINCGLEIQTGGKDNRELFRIRGDKDHVSSQGYTCKKALRLNYFQMGEDRIDSPLRRRDDGSYEKISWEVAIREVADGLRSIKQKYGGDKILFIGGGGQGNHSGGVYSDSLNRLLGVKYRSNALAQEKTGEFWVQGKMFGGGPHGDFEHAEVAIFLGKNPYQSHGFPRARKVLKEIARDPERTLVVIDPCTTETAKMADQHLAVKPGTDAWLLSAIIACLIQEERVDTDFIARHTEGYETIKPCFSNISIAEYSSICGIDEKVIRELAATIANANSVSVFEDLGVQQNINSTLVSYLQRIMWVITGHFAKQGCHNIPIPLVAVTDVAKGLDKNKARIEKKSPVLGSKVITGLIPCNTVPEEILTDHPDRFRAAIIESSNPVHSYADSPRMREAMDALEFSVVIDVAMTETASRAKYVLPASSPYEKYSWTFFSAEFPKNWLHLSPPIVDPLPGTLSEAEIYSRLVEAMNGLNPAYVKTLGAAARLGRTAYAAAFFSLFAAKPEIMKIVPVLLYRTLGPTLKGGKAAETAAIWGMCHLFARANKNYANNAGYDGFLLGTGEQLFEALLNGESGVIFADAGEYSDSWKRVRRQSGKILLNLTELTPEIEKLKAGFKSVDEAYPFVLAAGQRRSETTNVIIRDPAWDKKGKIGTLHIHPEDAAELNLKDRDTVRLTTPGGQGDVVIELSPAQPKGSLALPNGSGVEYQLGTGEQQRVGVSPNELTVSSARDFFAGTPWHKRVPARVDKLSEDSV